MKNQQSNFKKGIKHDLGKVRMDLIPVKPLLYVGKAFTHGAIEYGDRNWEKGLKWSRPYAAIQRHVLAFWDGEDLDPKSGLPHLAHLIAEAMFILEFMETHPELDDRPQK